LRAFLSLMKFICEVIMTEIRPRIQRLYDIGIGEFADGLFKSNQYSLNIGEDLGDKIENKGFKKILFVGYGFSSILPTLIGDFFHCEGIPIEIDTASEYKFETLNWKNDVNHSTLVFVNSFSGETKECLMAFSRLKKLTPNIIVITRGGKLLEGAMKENISYVRWELEEFDPEYPAFHLTQLFSILLDVFNKLGIISSNYQEKFRHLNLNLQEAENTAKEIASNLENVPICIVTTRDLLSVANTGRLLLNEIAMVPTFASEICEYYHSSIAIFTDLIQRMGILILKDHENGEFIGDRFEKLENLLSGNPKVSVGVIDLNQNNHFNKMFYPLLTMYYVTYYIARYYNIPGKDLISRMIENPFYKGDNFKKKTD